MPTKTKIVVGQKWYHKDDPNLVYTIEKIDGPNVYATRMKGSVVFGYRNRDGTGNWDEAKDAWKVLEEPRIVGVGYVSIEIRFVPRPPAVTDQDVYNFFRSVPTGNCACNIPRHQCKYHR